MEPEPKISDPLKQLRENAKDLFEKKEKKPETREKTMVEKNSPALVYQMPGPIGAAVNRLTYYGNLAQDRAAANAKNKHLIAGQAKAEPLKFVKDVHHQLGSLFNKAKEKLGKEKATDDHEHKR